MEETKIAVLIDAENISYKYIDDIFNAIKRDGKILISRLYGQYDVIKQWEKACNQYSIKINTQFNYVKGKNTTDSRLIIDAMDIMYQDQVNTFYILSSDSDYTGLITRIKEEDKTVVGVGNRNTPEPLINACNKFLYIENLITQKESPKTLNQKSNVPLSSIYSEIYSMISETNDSEKQISQIKEKLTNIFPDFNLKNYDGIPHKFLDFITNISGIEVFTKEDKNTYFARIKNEDKLINFIKANNTSTPKNNNSQNKPSLQELNMFIQDIFKNNKNEYLNLSLVNEKIKKAYPNFKIKNYGVNRFINLIKLINNNFVFNSNKTGFKIKN